jgi:tRNA(adenine34) deaminase
VGYDLELANFLAMKNFSFTEQDLFFMQKALKQAQLAYEEDEVPVGAVLVVNQKIVASGYNQVEKLCDPTAHAEILTLSSAPTVTGDWRLTEATLYCTLEPCSMCAGAILSARVKRLIWAAPDLRVGANGSWVDLFSGKHPFHRVDVAHGLLEEESAFLMQEFFRGKRKKDGKRVTCSH